jgi:putative transposase
MGHTYSNLLVHIIYSTKDRAPFITPDLKPRLYSYIGGIVRNLDGVLVEIGGIEDHVHLFVRFPPKLAIAELVGKVKSNSSKWAKREVPDFAWQAGYAPFSVSESAAADVQRYILNQEEHHRTMSFQDELRAFLRRNGIEFDERHIWN